MLEADLTGSDAHGGFRLAGYVRQLKRGAINPRASIPVLERSSASALIDGDHGMGHVGMTYAANLAVELARDAGVGGVGARRPNHARARDIRDFAAPGGGKGNVGQFVIAFDVSRFVPLPAFKAEVDRHIRDLVSSHRLPGRDAIRVPGMGRAARRAERERDGVPLSETVLAQVEELAKSLDIAPLSARA